MQKSKKIKYIIIAVIIILLIVVGVITLIINNADRTKIYDNVRVISDESGQNELLVNVEADRLIFKENPGYVTGDVLVSGITENTPGGFIRKVVSVSLEGDQYILETEPGLITDVFEEVHIEKTFLLSEEGATEVKSSGIGYSNSLNDIINSSVATATGITRSNDQLFEDGDYVFNIEEEFNIANALSVNAEVGFGLQLDFKLEIEKGDVVLGLTVHNAVGGEIFLGLSEELKKEFEKELLSKMLPSIQFMVGYVPVVITNEVSIALEGEANISGKLGTTIELEAEKIVGFEYNSATNKIVEINEDNYLADGTKWSVGGSVKGEVEAGIFIHLTSKLYGSTGIDLAAGVKGSASAELASTVDTDGSYEDCIGRIDLEVGPELEGSIVVTVPIIDYELVDCKIFETDLPAFWEEHWVSSENWEEELELIGNQYETEDEKIPDFQFSEDEEGSNSEENDLVETFNPDISNSAEPFYITAGDNRFILPIQLYELEQYGFDFSLCENETVPPGEIIVSILIYNGELWFFEVYNDGGNVRNTKECTAIGVAFVSDNELEQELHSEEGYTIAKGTVIDHICLGIDRQTVEEICYEKYDGFIVEEGTMLAVLVPRTENYADMLLMEFDENDKVININVFSSEH